MPYTQQVQKRNPACIVVLLSQSESMKNGLTSSQPKSVRAAEMVNHLLYILSIRSCRGNSIYDIFYVAVIGYGNYVGSLVGKEKRLASISELSHSPIRVEKQSQTRAGRTYDIVRPIWIDPVSEGPAQMCKAFEMAQAIANDFISGNPESFPPLIINISDGICDDGDVLECAKAITSLRTADGNALLFNFLLIDSDRSIVFPNESQWFWDQGLKDLYEVSSLLPDVINYCELELPENSRAIAINSELSPLHEKVIDSMLSYEAFPPHPR